MQTKQGAVLESLRAVDLFLDDNADRLSDVVDTGARRTLRAALAEIDTHATEQTASSLTASRGYDAGATCRAEVEDSARGNRLNA